MYKLKIKMGYVNGKEIFDNMYSKKESVLIEYAKQLHNKEFTIVKLEEEA